MIELSRERELVELAKRKDEHAFMEILKDARGKVWRVCLAYGNNHYDAEDILEDAIAVAWQNIDTFRGKSRFSTWLYSIASNIAKNKLSRRREFAVEDVGADLPTNESDTGEVVSARQVVHDALGQLSPDFREALILREYAQMSYKEIAIQQAVSIQTVKSRIHRARNIVKKIIVAQESV